jgi:hypothetical protein
MNTTRRSLANIANYHKKLKNYKKKYSRNVKTYNFKTVQDFENYERRQQNENTQNESNMMANQLTITTQNEKNTISRSPSPSGCIITPGGQKMKKANGKWVPCIFGGKRKTRKGKKSRRATRRRR